MTEQADAFEGLLAEEGSEAPKYVRLAAALAARMEAGALRPGDRLPSETALARNLPASLGTVQKALNQLAAAGLLERRQGVGTFVAGARRISSGTRTPQSELRHFRFLAEDGKTVLPVYARVARIERLTEEGPWSAFLGREGFYLRLERLLTVAEEFRLLAELYLPGGRFAALETLDPAELDGVLIRDFLSRRFRVAAHRVEQRLRLGLLPPRACAMSDAKLGTMGLVWELLSWSYRDEPLSYQRVFVPPSDRPLQLASAPLTPPPRSG